MEYSQRAIIEGLVLWRSSLEANWVAVKQMLSAHYEKWRLSGHQTLRDIADRFYPPLIVQPPPPWKLVRHRLAYIGQETMGWSWVKEQIGDTYDWKYPDMVSLRDFFEAADSVQALAEGYSQFDFAKHETKNYNSPFWRYFRRALSSVGERSETAAIFTNVIRCATNAEEGFTLRAVAGDIRDRFLQWQSGLLSGELRILQPSIIIFVTGPYYDDYLRAEFPDLVFEEVEGADIRCLARLRSDGLGASAYRTYHPGYANRSTGFQFMNAALADYLSRAP